MIDFTSTREGTDPQTKACARLLVAVIASAIRDASQPLGCEEREGGRPRVEPERAMRFLFDDTSFFPLYAKAIGSSAGSIRRNLLTLRKDEENRTFPLARRRALVDRYALWSTKQ